MARIPALEPPFTPDVEARLATMMPSGMPPVGLFRTFAMNVPMTIAMSHWLCGWYHAVCFAARVDLEPGAPRLADVTDA